MRHHATTLVLVLLAALLAEHATCKHLTLQAPAKVNLFLRITKKRHDSFHELASLFQTVNLCDELTFEQTRRTKPDHTDDDEPLATMEVTPDSVGYSLIPTDESNLVMRALLLYAQRVPADTKIHCVLRKRTPAQGGLGGGSSDAATALFAANRLAGYPVSQPQLIEWAGELGSDVGFFLSQGTAYCTGRGELVEERPPLPVCPVCLIKPAAGLSTPEVYRALGLQPGDELAGREPLELLTEFERDPLTASYVNDLEPPALSLMPKLAELRAELEALDFDAVMMSGSGSTFFCVGKPKVARDGWQEAIRTRYEAELYETSFCGRRGERLWYNE